MQDVKRVGKLTVWRLTGLAITCIKVIKNWMHCNSENYWQRQSAAKSAGNTWYYSWPPPGFI